MPRPSSSTEHPPRAKSIAASTLVAFASREFFSSSSTTPVRETIAVGGVSGHDVVLGLVGAPSLFDNPHASMFRGRSEVSGEAGRVVTCRSTEHTQSLCRERELAA